MAHWHRPAGRHLGLGPQYVHVGGGGVNAFRLSPSGILNMARWLPEVYDIPRTLSITTLSSFVERRTWQWKKRVRSVIQNQWENEMMFDMITVLCGDLSLESHWSCSLDNDPVRTDQCQAGSSPLRSPVLVLVLSHTNSRKYSLNTNSYQSNFCISVSSDQSTVKPLNLISKYFYA